jgi:nitrate reductase NapD
MVISALLVNIVPDRMEQVKAALLTIEGLKINSIIDDYKIVVVLESGNVEDEVEISKYIAKIDGVLGINLAYHHFDDEEE